ncbi:MAG: primosomal protein N' [Humidesulfovibrio sp.]|uniref:replication restart helicase PriA n=1 Tax=Humidesulfovibrio sp. TaxID=2910988 RepID=UPI0027337DAD|nr:primosomal protein N' [Humidesulfovibrio sp.]MDP2848643.1 primosomal protein N' [Humidesulfovibrio sp.]
MAAPRQASGPGIWQVWLASPPYAALTYLWPHWLPEPVPGLRVLAPLSRGLRVGVLERPCDNPPEGVELKPLLWPLEQTPVLDPDTLELVRDLAARHMAHPGRVLELILPRGLRTAQVRFDVDHKDFARSLAPKALAAMTPEQLTALAHAWAEGRMRVRISLRRQAQELYACLAADPPWPVRPNAVSQLRLLERLFESGPMSLGAVRAVFGDSGQQALKRLTLSGLVRLGDPDEAAESLDDVPAITPDPPECAPGPLALTATDEQRAALDELLPALESPEARMSLVHGVTGSGKTHIYLELTRRALALGRSALLMAPEVALASQLWRQVRAAFPDAEAYFSHGYQTPSRREETFARVASARGPVLVVGTRSALFLPLRNLGLVVLDEEHDESYKQEERLPYHAKELAFTRIRRSGGLLVLGSATPDVKTFHAAQNGQLPLQALARRVGCRPMPAVRLVDISGAKADEPFAPESLAAIRGALEGGEQVIVMLNRRGYAPVMYCMSCEEVPKCPECQVGLTYHKLRERLTCHYCGFTHPYPMPCAKCGGTMFVPMGDGTERIEEYFQQTLGHKVSVLRMDRDSARRQERLDEILRRFAAGEAQVLVGTQMLSKGHHFPGVTLVVVANADMGLNLPDYRAAERTFQLLVQVSGRAGRGEKSGQVLIQTRNPAHPFWHFVLGADYAGFYEREIAQRQRFRYPPFTRLALLRLSCPVDAEHLQQCLQAFGKTLRETAKPLGVDVLGPAPAPLAQLKGRKRFNCLLKCSDWQSIRSLYSALSRAGAVPKAFRLELDLDPVNML